jgi:CHASE3 domain sensor protein
MISPREEQTELLREVLTAQDRTNELLEELVGVMATQQKQRASELHQWRNAHPKLAVACREAAEALSRVQIDYLNRMTDEINDSSDDMVEGEFVLNEFVDRYGPRLAHLNGVIQVLAQLSSVPNPANTQS